MVLLARVIWLAKISASCRLRFSANKKTTRRRRKPNGGIFSLCGIFKGTHIIKCRKFTLSAKGESIRQIECAFPKTSFWNAQLIIKNIKPQTHGKSQRSEIFVNKAAEPRRKRAMPDRVLRQTSLVRSRKNVVLLARVNIFIPITLSVRQRIAKFRAKNT